MARKGLAGGKTLSFEVQMLVRAFDKRRHMLFYYAGPWWWCKGGDLRSGSQMHVVLPSLLEQPLGWIFPQQLPRWRRQTRHHGQAMLSAPVVHKAHRVNLAPLKVKHNRWRNVQVCCEALGALGR
jgi:hypothetical protein